MSRRRYAIDGNIFWTEFIVIEEKFYSLYDDSPKSSAVSFKDTEYHIQAEKLIGKQNGSPHAV